MEPFFLLITTRGPIILNTIRAARKAMATRFEIILHSHQRKDWLQSVAEEILDEIDRIESQLSRYMPTSQIARANRLAALQPVKLDPQVFQLLEDCIQWHQQTRGAFDITAGPLLKCWGFTDGQYREPSRDTIESTLEHVGIHHIQLEPGSHTISFDTEGVTLDLGAVGKGYAMERAKEILADYEIESAILHGGTSTICAVGTPPDDVAWHVGIVRPEKDLASPFADRSATAQPSSVSDLLTSVALTDASLSISAVWGKSFQSGDRTFGHIIDPRNGYPVSDQWLTAIVHENALSSDVLTTAMLVDGTQLNENLSEHLMGKQWLMIQQGEEKDTYEVVSQGMGHNPIQRSPTLPESGEAP